MIIKNQRIIIKFRLSIKMTDVVVIPATKLFRFGRRENCDCEYSDILSCLSSPGTVTTGCIGMDLFDIVSMLYPSNSAVKDENNMNLL
jgi:hypothetical protein